MDAGLNESTARLLFQQELAKYKAESHLLVPQA